MVAELSITTNLASVAARFAYMGDALPAALNQGIAIIAEDIRGVVTPLIMQETPYRTGNLMGSTSGEVLPLPNATAEIQITQPAANPRDGFHYALAVIEGHRIVAKGGHDTGKRTRPNPYPQRVLDAVGPEIEMTVTTAIKEIEGLAFENLGKGGE